MSALRVKFMLPGAEPIWIDADKNDRAVLPVDRAAASVRYEFWRGDQMVGGDFFRPAGGLIPGDNVAATLFKSPSMRMA